MFPWITQRGHYVILIADLGKHTLLFGNKVFYTNSNNVNIPVNTLSLFVFIATKIDYPSDKLMLSPEDPDV